MEKKKVLILGNSSLSVFGFREELIRKLIAEGYRVIVSFPNGVFGEGEGKSRSLGCRFIETRIDRRKKNPFSDLMLLLRYIRMINALKPDIVLAYTVKCDIYGGIACRITKTPFIANITGIGKGLDDGGILGKIMIFLYRIALKKSKEVFFQNTSDQAFFEKNKIRFRHGKLIPGSGVNLTKFIPMPYPSDESVVFTFVGRVMKAKGIEQFMDAARQVRQRYPMSSFHICGYCEEDYKDIIEKADDRGDVVYHGLVEDVTDYIRKSHCIVLPSFHPEGISNALLEAAAMARPIITTDRPGCRETVEDGISGFLVRDRDVQDLVDKIELFLSLSNIERATMGQNGRKKVEEEFDRNTVVKAYMECIGRFSN